MNVITFLDRVGRGGSGRPSTLQDGIRLTLNKTSQGIGKEANPFDLAVRVSLKTMEAMRWVAGDRVTLDINPTKSEACISRVVGKNTPVSWCLSPSSGCAKKENLGKMVPAVFRIRGYKRLLIALGMEDLAPGESYDPETFITDSVGVTFPLRKQWRVNCIT